MLLSWHVGRVLGKPLMQKFVPDTKWINYLNTGGKRMMVAAATIVIMAAVKKVQQNVFALYHTYNCTIFLGFIWILVLHFKIVLVIPVRCNNGKRKCDLDDGCTILIFSTDDGCTRWWRWLHHFLRVIFDTHTQPIPCTQIYIYAVWLLSRV